MMSAWFVCSVLLELMSVVLGILSVVYLTNNAQDGYYWWSIAFAVGAAACQALSHHAHRWRPTADAYLDAMVRFFAQLTAVCWVVFHKTTVAEKGHQATQYVALVCIVSLLLSVVLSTFRRRVKSVSVSTAQEGVTRMDRTLRNYWSSMFASR